MKILIVSHSYVAAENLKNIIELSKSASVRIIVPDHVADRVIGKVTNDEETPVDRLVFKRISLPRNQYLLASKGFGMLSFSPDIVHIEYDPWAPIFWQTLIFKALFARKAKLVCTVKKNTYRPLPQPQQAAKLWLTRLLLTQVDCLFAVNTGVQKIYQSRFGVRDEDIVLVQHLGVDTELFKPSQKSLTTSRTMKIGYCGRLDENKGLRILYQAVQSIKSSSDAEVELHLLGDGPLKEELQARQEGWLYLAPPVSHNEVADFLKPLDIFVMPALITPDHEEHDGHALMEAMSCGIACVGTPSGIIPELLDEGTGVICRAGDVKDLTEALHALINSSDLRSEMGAKGRAKIVEDCSISALGSQKLQLYESILA